MLSGTVMAIQEKKTAKGMPFAIVKFSDLSRMFEFFIFSEVLISNREKLIPGKSFLISVKREMLKTGIERTNVSRIFLIDDIKEKNIRKLNIQIKESDNLEILKKEIIKEGKTSVSLNYIQNGRNFIFKFKNEKNLNSESLKTLENHGFLTKIIN